MRLTDRLENTSVDDNDLVHIVDVSDTTQNPNGSSFKVRLLSVLNWLRQKVITFTQKITFSSAPRFSSTTASQYLKVDANKDLESVATIPYSDISGAPSVPNEVSLATIQNEATTESTTYTSPRRFWSGLARFISLGWTWVEKQLFSKGINVGNNTSPNTNGDLWYNPTTHKFQGRANGATVTLQDTPSFIATGNILYVSPNATDASGASVASDSWTRAQALGRQDRPFVTYAAAQTQAVSGDTIICRGLTGSMYVAKSAATLLVILENCTLTQLQIETGAGTTSTSRLYVSSYNSTITTLSSFANGGGGNDLIAWFNGNLSTNVGTVQEVGIIRVYNSFISTALAGTFGANMYLYNCYINLSSPATYIKAKIILEQCKIFSSLTAYNVEAWGVNFELIDCNFYNRSVALFELGGQTGGGAITHNIKIKGGTYSTTANLINYRLVAGVLTPTLNLTLQDLVLKCANVINAIQVAVTSQRTYRTLIKNVVKDNLSAFINDTNTNGFINPINEQNEVLATANIDYYITEKLF